MQNSAHTPKNYRDIISKYPNAIEEMIQEYQYKLGVDEINKNEILFGLSTCDWEEGDKKKALIAAIFYKIVSNSKGEHAFYFEQNLRENFRKEGDAKKEFNIPSYIEDALMKIIE